jgi:hypothetical protein
LKRRLDFAQHIKYSLIFDEVLDKPELDKLFGLEKGKQSPGHMLLSEIQEEEQLQENLNKKED